MAEHQFICLLIANIANIELAVFSADDAIEHHVLQHIAQLRQRLSCTPRYRHALLLLCALIIE